MQSKFIYIARTNQEARIIVPVFVIVFLHEPVVVFPSSKKLKVLVEPFLQALKRSTDVRPSSYVVLNCVDVSLRVIALPVELFHSLLKLFVDIRNHL